ncbi:MAG: hypothetical protein JF567_02385 [Xanthomonadales bacterium]|nr:hypothetical protein [Xanthomonadales bacterium]
MASATAASESHLPGVIALELSSDNAPPRAAIDTDSAARLLEHLARDLALLVPGLEKLDLTLAGAHFDVAEALRPGWPLHRRLDELRARAPGQATRKDAQLIAFGADGNGAIPQPLQCDPVLAGASLRVLPFLISGEEGAIAAVGDILENELLDRGMASAATALLAQDAFATRIEHMRYLTLHDLLAMTSMQYGHMGLDPLWPILETALLAPGEDAEIDAPPEPLLRLRGGEVSITLFPLQEWGRRYATDNDDPERLQRQMSRFEARQRQLAAVLEAHGIPVVYDYLTGATLGA